MKTKKELEKYNKEWHLKNPSKAYLYQRNYLRRLRIAVVSILGSKCVVCGFSDPRALQVDHINGGGQKEINTIHRNTYYGMVIKSVLNKENKYQLLCANCNWIKRVEKGEQCQCKEMRVPDDN